MDFVSWIKDGLKKPGKTQRGLAKKLGRADSAISAMLHDGRNLKAVEIQPIAEYLEIDPPYSGHQKFVSIVGFIDIGKHPLRVQLADNPTEEIAVPAGGGEAQAALMVKGPEMPGLLKDGWAVFYGDQKSPPEESQIGELCVCEIEDGSIIFGFLMNSRYEGHFDIQMSTDSLLLAQRVIWAATVTNLVPKPAVPALLRKEKGNAER